MPSSDPRDQHAPFRCEGTEDAASLSQRDTRDTRDTRVVRVGCVSYLNAKPLIDGLDDDPSLAIRYDVPSGLLADLETGEVDIALCPTIDYFRSAMPLMIVPAGGIGCDGVTMTVRLYSQVELGAIDTIHADTDSHTSIALMRVILAKRFGLRPRIIDYHAREHVAEHRPIDWPKAMLLIGDKVVTDSPPAVRYPFQLDLGYAWKRLTGLPFVFAVWMARPEAKLGSIPDRLAAQRAHNVNHIEDIVARHAKRHGWPDDLAAQYLGVNLRYAIGERELEAITTFGQYVNEIDALDQPHSRQSLMLYPRTSVGSDSSS